MTEKRLITPAAAAEIRKLRDVATAADGAIRTRKCDNCKLCETWVASYDAARKLVTVPAL